jgi:hypothetical protein
MTFNKQDLLNCENLVKALRKSSFSLEGMEVLAMAECIKWLNKLCGDMQSEIKSENQANPPSS